MWPWSDEDRARGYNTAFVAFMRREDAERAMGALQGALLANIELRLSWHRAIQIPARPCYPPASHVDPDTLVPVRRPAALPFLLSTCPAC